ncbi:MAG: type 1 glutamine amidotransferase [Deltaproteobacteria bacterium]|nr:type 1 glutamine amidotransferase [Deltaproteobacteria bacterium]
MRLLLIQIRALGDPMIAHEQQCIARRLGRRPYLLTTRNVFEQPPQPGWLDGVDALLVGGSGAFSVHDPRSQPWVSGLRRICERALTQAVPSFGICFGHQLLGLHLGGEVVTRERASERGTIELRLTDDGLADPIFGSLPARFRAHTGHSDSVPHAPESVVLLATAEACPTQAFRVRGAPFWSVQFHPDLRGEEARERYRAFASELPPEQAALARAHARLFDPEADDTAGLLGAFLDHVR